MDDERDRRFDLENRLIDFAARVMDVVDSLPSAPAGKHIAGQLMRSGTAPAANYAEAQGAESRADFIHKMRLALKELRETNVWLRLVKTKSLITPADRLVPLLQECNELIAIFMASVGTAIRNKTS